MSDLLELVRDCEKASDIVEDMVKIKAMGDKAKRLYDLGLVKVAQGIMDEADQKYRMKRVADGGYIRITDAKIKAFLERKAKEYDRGRKVPTAWGESADSLNAAFARIHAGDGRAVG